MRSFANARALWNARSDSPMPSSPTAKRAAFIMMNMYSRPRFSSPMSSPTAPPCCPIGEHAGGTRVNAELVLDRQAAHVVALAERAVGIHQELRHHEQGHALHALGRTRGAREHHVDDVLGEIVLAVGDEDLLALELVAAAADRLRAGAHRREIRAGLRLGEVHGARPFTGHHLRQIRLLQALRSLEIDGLDRAASEHRARA